MSSPSCVVLEFLFNLTYLLPEVRVLTDTLLNLADTVKHRGMRATAHDIAYVLGSITSMLLYQIHSYMTPLHILRLAALTVYLLMSNLVMTAHRLDDVVSSQFAPRISGVGLEYLLGEVQVNVIAAHDAVSEHRVYHTLQFADIVLKIFSNIVNDFLGNIKTVTTNEILQYFYLDYMQQTDGMQMIEDMEESLKRLVLA